MSLKRRTFSFEDDLDLVRRLLLDIYTKIGALNYLIPTKIENLKFGPCGPTYTTDDDEDILIWELEDSTGLRKPIAISHRGGAANYHIEILPHYKSLEKEIFLELEEYENSIRQNHKRIIHYTTESDSQRSEVLTQLNYRLVEFHEYNYRIPLINPNLNLDLPSGFEIKNINPETDSNKFQQLLGQLHSHCKEFATIEKIQFFHLAEFYHADLDLVMANSNGEFVSLCQFRLDPLTNIAELELVGTLDEYSEFELEKYLINEGMIRLKPYNPKEVYSVEVDIRDEFFNSLLQSTGFVINESLYMWEKRDFRKEKRMG